MLNEEAAADRRRRRPAAWRVVAVACLALTAMLLVATRAPVGERQAVAAGRTGRRWTPSAAARRVKAAGDPLQPAAAAGAAGEAAGGPDAASPGGRNYLVGYGSLMNARSRAKTGDTGSAYPARLSGYRREWSYGQRKRSMTALGVRETGRKEDTLNAVVVTVARASLPKFDEREVRYRRVEVPHDRISWIGDALPRLAAGDHVWVYLNEANVEPTEPLPVMESYVDVVLEGCLKYGEEFARECIRTTHLWDDRHGKATVTWVDDRESPKIYERGFVPQQTVRKIDALLKEVVPRELEDRKPIAAAVKVAPPLEASERETAAPATAAASGTVPPGHTVPARVTHPVRTDKVVAAHA